MGTHQVLRGSLVAFYNAQRAVPVTPPGCLGTCHSLPSMMTTSTGGLHGGELPAARRAGSLLLAQRHTPAGAMNWGGGAEALI